MLIFGPLGKFQFYTCHRCGCGRDIFIQTKISPRRLFWRIENRTAPVPPDIRLSRHRYADAGIAAAETATFSPDVVKRRHHALLTGIDGIS